MEASDVLCDLCRSLALKRVDFEDPPFEPEGRYHQIILTDSLDNLQQKAPRCHLCYLFWQAIKFNEQTQPHVLQEATVFEVSWMQSNMEYEHTITEDENAWGSALYPKAQHPDSNSNYGLQLVDESDTSAFLRGRVIAPHIDVSMIKGWLNRCSNEHGPDCIDVGFAAPAHPLSLGVEFLVIDVIANRLCRLPAGETYVTLSYVWGSKEVPSTLTTNVERYKQPGKLDGEFIPKTIRDAIQVAKALGQRFLWVDAFCIVQDHPTKHDLIRNMDAVYTHANLCIVASSSSDANTGLSGWSNRLSRSDTIPIRSVEPGIRLGVLPFFDGELMISPHAQRAWTFQEGALSTRCLVFHNSVVYFCCRQSIWREDIHTELPDRVECITGANVLARTLDIYPIRRYAQVVSAYTERNLTFQCDALNAFAGIERSLSRSMGFTRFWYGLPASLFDLVIMWQAAWHVTLTRRIEFPSYSWVGWQGSVSLLSDVDSNFDQRWLLFRTWIRWYIVDTNHQLVHVWDPVRDGVTQSELSLKHQAHQESDQSSSQASDGFGAQNTDDQDTQTETVIVEDGLENIKHDGRNTEEESEGEEESSACPQYGWPIPGNPYGRFPNHAFEKEFSQSAPPEFTSSTTQQLTPGTLCFETYVAVFHLDQIQLKEPQYALSFTLHDVENRLCGAISHHGTLTDSIEHSHHEGYDHRRKTATLLILSYAGPGHKSLMSSLKLKLSPPYEAQEAGDGVDGEMWAEDEWHTWDMFNVMLVRSNPREPVHSKGEIIYECAGIGLLHKEALNHALEPAKWTRVLLF